MNISKKDKSYIEEGQECNFISCLILKKKNWLLFVQI